MPAQRPTPKPRTTKPKPAQFGDASGDFLAFVEDVKRKDTRPFNLGDKTFYLRGPSLLSDAEVESLNGRTDDVVAKARVMIDDYDAFAAAGGTAMLLMSYYDTVFPAAEVGEGKASSTS